jgi:hypothetical protein
MARQYSGCRRLARYKAAVKAEATTSYVLFSRQRRINTTIEPRHDQSKRPRTTNAPLSVAMMNDESDPSYGNAA